MKQNNTNSSCGLLLILIHDGWLASRGSRPAARFVIQLNLTAARVILILFFEENKFRLFLYHNYVARARAHQRRYDGRKAATPIVTLSPWCPHPSSGGFLQRDARTSRVWLWGRAGPRPCGYQWGHSRSSVYAWRAQNNMGRPIGIIGQP